jgi:hypothetical protein
VKLLIKSDLKQFHFGQVIRADKIGGVEQRKDHLDSTLLRLRSDHFLAFEHDRVPKTVFDHCPKLMRLYREFGEHLGVKAWIERTTR